MELKLKRLHLENFKCHKQLDIALDGRNTSIYGDNATGKTSVYDSLTWLLFGKDSLGNGEKNIDIKPLNADGQVADHQAVTEVEAVFLVDGEEVSLKRTYRELWTTRRGSSESSYEGNTSEYYVDGVPCKLNAYKARVAEMVDEEQFRLLTSVSWFAAGIPWVKRRELLFDLFGGLGDRDILATDGQFAPLVEAMGKRSLEDTKKMLAQEKKGYQVARNEVPARISECEKTIQDLAGTDWEEADRERRTLLLKKEGLQTKALGIQQNTAVQKAQAELQEAQAAKAQLVAQNIRHRAEQERGKPDTVELSRRLRYSRENIRRAELTLEGLKGRAERLGKKIEESRRDWIARNAEEYSVDDCCPTCGQRLPEERLQQAAAAFAARKKRDLEMFVRDAEAYKRIKAQEEQDIQEVSENLEMLRKEAAELQQELSKAEAASAIEISDLPEYDKNLQALDEQIRQLEQALKQLQQEGENAIWDIRRRISEVDREIEGYNEVLGKKSAYEYAQARIETLRTEAKEAADKLARVEGLLHLAEEFSRYKASFLEAGMNRHFRLAEFRLFREQANGGVEDRCDVTYGGVPYLGLNNGMKINVGIDIINALSKAYGVTVPLFIDNAESVTNLESCRCQVIRLVVSEQDKELRIE